MTKVVCYDPRIRQSLWKEPIRLELPMSHQSLGRWRQRPDHLVGDAGEMASEDSDTCFDNLGAS